MIETVGEERVQERDYALVVVAYRSADLVASLLKGLGPGFPAVIVDNFQGQDGLAELVADRPGTTYISGPGAGFAVAANIGSDASPHDTVVIVNPDSVPTAEQIDALVANLRTDERIAQVCATAVDDEGRVELGTGGWEPSVWRALVHATGAHRFFPEAGLWARPAAFAEPDLDWYCGPVTAVSRPILRELGGLDEEFFVYNEDVDFSRRVRKAGYRQILRTDILVPHRAGNSGDTKARMLRFRGASMMRDVGRHHGVVSSALIRLVLTAGSLGRAGVNVVLRRRSAASGHIAYVHGMWGGQPPRD